MMILGERRDSNQSVQVSETTLPEEDEFPF
jgi:hypothetical protein